MSPEAQRMAIATACGWSHRTFGNHTYWWHEENNKSLPMCDDGMRSCPNCFGDLNAMHEAEKALTDKQMVRYDRILSETCDGYDWHATASQRAKAFLCAIGKWID